MKPWKVILTDTALADLDHILDTTLEEFGTTQLKRYTEQIESAIRELEESGNRAPLLKQRSDIRPGWVDIPAVANNQLYEIKSPLILQPGPAALTDGLDALCGIIDRV